METLPVGNTTRGFSSLPSVVSWLQIKNSSQAQFSPKVVFPEKDAVKLGVLTQTNANTSTEAASKRRRRDRAHAADEACSIDKDKIRSKVSSMPMIKEDTSSSISALVPSYCRQLLSKKIVNPNGGTPVFPYVLQMLGSTTPYYVGCPVEVKVNTEDRWVKGMISSMLSSSKSAPPRQSILLYDGSTVEMIDLENTVRPDVESCGRFAVGRHAQVLFEGGVWYVGVIVHVQKKPDLSADNSAMRRGNGCRKRDCPAVLRVVFEDGDRVEAVAGDSGIMLLPTEWSDHVAEAGEWGWWGYNRDRVKRSLEVGKEKWLAFMSPAKAFPPKRKLSSDPSSIDKAKPLKKQRRDASSDPHTQNNGTPEAISLFQTLVPNPWEAGSRVQSYLVQMRGSSQKYYIGCPVEWCEDSQSAWEKGTVTAPGTETENTAQVVLHSGRRVQADAKADDGLRIRPDVSVLGKFAVGRHAQVLFEDGIWYVGIVVGTSGAGCEPSIARIRFEDGEEVEVSVGEKDVMLLPQEWSEVVATAGTFGWWGYNVDRVRMCRQHAAPIGALGQNVNEKAGVKRKPVGRPPNAVVAAAANEPQAPAARKQSGVRVKRTAAVIVPPTGLARLKPFAIPQPHTKLERQRSAPPDSDSDDDADPGVLSMSALALAVTLCDSLRSAAFVDGWDDCAARNKWKERICRHGADWKHFAAQLRVFEGKLARSASLPVYAAARPALMEALTEVADEELARHCVQLLAGLVSM